MPHYEIGGSLGGYISGNSNENSLLLCKEICIRYFHKKQSIHRYHLIMIEKPQ